MWCVVRGLRIIVPIFFHDTVNLEHYVSSICELFFQIFTEEEKQHAYFLQDKKTAHISQYSVEVLCEIFSERMIIWGLMATSFYRVEYMLFLSMRKTGVKHV
jgi:hypothetical protein